MCLFIYFLKLIYLLFIIFFCTWTSLNGNNLESWFGAIGSNYEHSPKNYNPE